MPTMRPFPRYRYASSISLITGMPLALICFTSAFFSGIPGLFITSSPFSIRSSLCFPSSYSMSFSSSVCLYCSDIFPPSETNTSYPFCLARMAAPTPLSPAPSMIILFGMPSCFISSSPDLQCYDRKHHTEYGHDPESRYDLALIITQLLIMMVQRAHEKYPLPVPIFLSRIFEIGHLQYHADILNQEYPAEYRYQQFFSYDECQRSNYSAEHQATGVSHEYRCRIGIVPEKSETGSDQRTDEYGQFTQVGYVHDVQVLGKPEVSTGVGKHTETGSDDRTHTGGQPIHTVCNVGPVGYGCNNEYHDHDVQYPGSPMHPRW